MKRVLMFVTYKCAEFRHAGKEIIVVVPEMGQERMRMKKKTGKIRRVVAALLAAALLATGVFAVAWAAVPSVEAQHKVLEKPSIKVPEA